MLRWTLYFMLATVCGASVILAQASELSAPDQVTAGQPATIHSDVSGSLIVVGPGKVFRRSIKAGEDAILKPEEIRNAGLYILSIGGASKSFFVTPGPAKRLSFLARPSRVPVAQHDVISGTAFVFDEYENLVTAPAGVKFDLTVRNVSNFSRTVMSRDGVAYVLTASGPREGAAQFVASLGDGDVPVRRVVQQVASDPCGIHMMAQKEESAILLETSPIRDCSGNAIPDGTIVTFTSIEEGGSRSQVDARIRKGIAKAQLPVPASRALLQVAAGVVVGNEIRWEGDKR